MRSYSFRDMKNISNKGPSSMKHCVYENKSNKNGII